MVNALGYEVTRFFRAPAIFLSKEDRRDISFLGFYPEFTLTLERCCCLRDLILRNPHLIVIGLDMKDVASHAAIRVDKNFRLWVTGKGHKDILPQNSKIGILFISQSAMKALHTTIAQLQEERQSFLKWSTSSLVGMGTGIATLALMPQLSLVKIAGVALGLFSTGSFLYSLYDYFSLKS